jgi:hypothetical protein
MSSHFDRDHDRDKKFSTTPLTPPQKISAGVWSIGPGTHAGENDLL